MIVHVRQSLPHAPREATQHAERDGYPHSSKPLDPMVAEAVRLIHEAINQPPRVPQIARQLGVSQRSLNRWFQKELGCTVKQVIRTIRLACARQWLVARPELTVTQVAALVGYSSPNRMENHFQEVLGLTPRQYRRQLAPKSSA